MDPVEQDWVCCCRRMCRHNCFRPAVRGGAGAGCVVGRGRGTAAKAERTRINRRRSGREDLSAVWRPQWHAQGPAAGWVCWCAVRIAAANLLTAGCNFRCSGGHVGMCGWARRLEDGRGGRTEGHRATKIALDSFALSRRPHFSSRGATEVEDGSEKPGSSQRAVVV